MTQINSTGLLEMCSSAFTALAEKTVPSTLQAVSSGGLSAAEGASKLVAYLQEVSAGNVPSLNIASNQSLPSQQPVPIEEGFIRASVSSSGQTAKPEGSPEEGLNAGLQGQGTPAAEAPPPKPVQLDLEVPAPRKKMSGEEKLKSWLTTGLQVPAPPRAQPGVVMNGFSENPTGRGVLLRPPFGPSPRVPVHNKGFFHFAFAMRLKRCHSIANIYSSHDVSTISFPPLF